ncbi:MAG: GldG family protein [Patescibacteria group bacterium]|nr:GldG family protein [Patescibacteria group bacterium]
MKKIKQRSETYVTLLSIIGIIILVNFFSYKIFTRLDLTQNKEFTVSAVTKNTLKNLDDVVNIKVYFSKNLPSQFISLRENVGDILDAYDNYSSGNVRIEFIDPTDDEELASSLYAQGIPELQFEVFEKDQMQLVRGYMGMSIGYGSDSEIIPVVQDTKSLEYQITLAIKKLTSGETIKLGLLNGYGSLDRESLGGGIQKLEELYEVVDVDLLSVEEIDTSLKTLIIVSPKEEIPEGGLVKIDAYVAKGGNLLVLDEGVAIDEGLQATNKNNGLNNLLTNYGIKINNDMVLESKANSGVASFNQGFFTFQTSYSYWPKIAKDGFDQDNSAVSKLENVVLQWASSIDVDKTKLGENYNISYLAKSSDKSWRQTGKYDLNPQQTFTPNKTQTSNLAVDVSAKFKSPYGIEDTIFSRILVVGDSDFASGNLVTMADNLVFFQNITDSLSLDGDLIEVRSKGITSRPIETDISDGQKVLIRYLNVFGVTVLVLTIGLSRYFLRKKSRFVDDL